MQNKWVEKKDVLNVEVRREELTDKQTTALLKLAKGLIAHIEVVESWERTQPPHRL